MTQKQRLLNYLRSGRRLNNLISWRELGIYATSQRVGDLIKEGLPVKKGMKKVYNKVGEACRVREYWIDELEENFGQSQRDKGPEGPKRSPLARGRRYQYRGFPSGFTVKHVAFRGHPEDDGGLQGVAIEWWGFPKGGRTGSSFYPCRSEAEFFNTDTFSNAYDCDRLEEALNTEERQ